MTLIDYIYAQVAGSVKSSYQSFKMSKNKVATASKNVLKDFNASKDSIAFKKVTDSNLIQFPKQDNYYIYVPPKPDASLFERLSAFLSLIYYKYLLHSGVYVMNKNERRIVNTIVVLSVILSSYQILKLALTVLGY